MHALRHVGRWGQTVRQRFTALYAVVFLASGIGLLVLTNLLVAGQVSESQPVQRPAAGPSSIEAAQQVIRQLEGQLAGIHATQSRQLLLGSLIALGVMSAISVVLGRAVAGRVLRPLRSITAATRRISADNLHERLAVEGPRDEVKDLADTIDALLERLEASFAAQRRFVANASHELRTPLATIRASLDVAVAKPQTSPQLRALEARLRTELDGVDRILEDFLVLARAQHGALPDLLRTALGDLVGDCIAAFSDAIAAKGLTTDIDLDDRGWTWGDPSLLSRLVDNVVGNAIIHNTEGGWIGLTTATEGALVHLVVATSGPPLDPAHVARLAEPFRRLAADRTATGTGSGLGLSIVAAIARAHGGGLELQARPEGGLRVTVSLPAAAPPQDGSDA